MIKFILKKSILIIFILVVLFSMISLFLYYSYTPKISDWQVKNDNVDFVQYGYLVEFLPNLDSINIHKILNRKKYQKALMQKANQYGILTADIEKALTEYSKEFKGTVPVFIETIYYKNRPAFAVIYKYYYGNHTLKNYHLENNPLLRLLISEGYKYPHYGVLIFDIGNSSIVNNIY